MFLKLFGSIRNNGVPVTLKEYLDLLEGLSKGLCSSNKIEDFYNFCRQPENVIFHGGGVKNLFLMM